MKCNPKNSCVNCDLGGINIKITNKCNGNCKFCIEKDGYCPKAASVQELIKATNTLHTSQNLLILGGEPLMYEHLEEYLNGVQNENRKIYLTTNGTLLTHEMAEMLSKYLSGINISIHHYLESKNREIYGIENYSFLPIFSAIRDFKKNGVPVRINCTLVKGVIETKKDANDMINFARFMGADSLRLSEVQNQEDMYVDARDLFAGLTDNPYEDGCEQIVFEEDGFTATVKLGCGFVNKRKPLPNDPDRKTNIRRVVYPNGDIKDGWYKIEKGKAEYYGVNQPVKYKTEYIYNTNTNSCY